MAAVRFSRTHRNHVCERLKLGKHIAYKKDGTQHTTATATIHHLIGGKQNVTKTKVLHLFLLHNAHDTVQKSNIYQTTRPTTQPTYTK